MGDALVLGRSMIIYCVFFQLVGWFLSSSPAFLFHSLYLLRDIA